MGYFRAAWGCISCLLQFVQQEERSRTSFRHTLVVQIICKKIQNLIRNSALNTSCFLFDLCVSDDNEDLKRLLQCYSVCKALSFFPRGVSFLRSARKYCAVRNEKNEYCRWTNNLVTFSVGFKTIAWLFLGYCRITAFRS